MTELTAKALTITAILAGTITVMMTTVGMTMAMITVMMTMANMTIVMMTTAEMIITTDTRIILESNNCDMNCLSKSRKFFRYMVK